MFDLLIATAALALSAGEVRTPPSSQCFDARAVSEVWWQSPTQMVVASGQRLHRVSMAVACPAAETGSTLLARDGWVCGSGGEFVQSAGERCSISAVEPLNASQTRRAMRERRHAEADLTATPLRQAFAGSVAHCLDPTRMRAWSLDGNDLIVSTARAGANGPTRFRVTLSSSCPEAAVRDVLHWRSATGLGRICGVPGEFAVFTSQHSSVVNLTRSFLSGPPVSAELVGCPIASLEAIDR